MKKIYTTFVVVLVLIQISSAQNTFPGGGNAGINVLTPAQSLEINGINLSGYPATSGTTQTSSLLRLGNYSSSSSVLDIGVNAKFGSWLQATSRGDLSLKLPLLLNPNGGNIGVGTLAPSSFFDIHGATNSNILSVEDATRGLVLQTSAAGTGNAGIVGFYNNVYNALDIRATPGVGTGIYLSSSGNIGINTAVPKETLSVNGNIRSKQVKVELTNWPDYVFKPKYNLPLLKDLKAYIEQNQHLPDMPPEAEITKDGLNLGEMVKLQTKKIEELTLYIIQQEENNKKLSDENANLKKAQQKINQDQEARISILEKILLKQNRHKRKIK